MVTVTDLWKSQYKQVKLPSFKSENASQRGQEHKTGDQGGAVATASTPTTAPRKDTISSSEHSKGSFYKADANFTQNGSILDLTPPPSLVSARAEATPNRFEVQVVFDVAEDDVEPPSSYPSLYDNSSQRVLPANPTESNEGAESMDIDSK